MRVRPAKVAVGGSVLSHDGDGARVRFADVCCVIVPSDALNRHQAVPVSVDASPLRLERRGLRRSEERRARQSAFGSGRRVSPRQGRLRHNHGRRRYRESSF